jgi:hypothetical protein
MQISGGCCTGYIGAGYSYIEARETLTSEAGYSLHLTSIQLTREASYGFFTLEAEPVFA